MHKQSHRSALPGGQTETAASLERRLQLTFVNAPGALPCRPQPRAAFDNAARADSPFRPWQMLALPLRATARAARAIGGRTAEETEHRIIATIAALLEYVLEPFGTVSHPCDGATFLVLVREESEALEAQALARAVPSAENRARAFHETTEANGMQRLYCGALALDFPRPMGVR